VTIARLHFVYNVELTPAALLRDFIHRLTDPATYPCKLCDLTYGRFVKKPGWQLFLYSLPVRSSFYTRDQFAKSHPQLASHEFPVVLAEHDDGSFRVFLSRGEMKEMTTLDELESAVRSRLQPETVRSVS